MRRAPDAPPPAGLTRRLASLGYELLLLVAVLMTGALPFLLATRDLDHAIARPLLQAYLALLGGVYFIWQWWRGGQTLPMKTWRLRLVTREGGPLSPARAATRYALAFAGTLALGAGFAWALVDRNRLFLHDRLAGTTIVKEEE